MARGCFCEQMTKLRVGIDFGYRYTGLAVLDSGNKVLSARVITHRGDLSQTLLERRGNRSARRRNKTRIARLRNFRALLAGLGLAPRAEGGAQTAAQKTGGELYAIAHRRGWDYGSLRELLVGEDGKAGAVVKEVDEMLLDMLPPENRREDTRYHKGKPRVRRVICAHGKDQTCLGELAQWRKESDKLHNELQKTAHANKAEQLAARADELRDKYDALSGRLENADKEQVEQWLAERLAACGVAKEKRKNAAAEIMVRLGLNDGEVLHGEGKLYAPHKNRHRNEFVKELCGKLSRAMSLPPVAAKLKENAHKRGITTEQAQELWIKNAVAVLDANNPERKRNKGERKRSRDIRPARFDNRHTGKCPALKADGARCARNLPKKSKAEIRRLQFEIEARQMNIKDKDGGERKLSNGEVCELTACADFERGKLADNGEKWKAFFAEHKTPPVAGGARGKKDILKDIAIGAQSGRGGLCAEHLREKLRLLAEGKSESEEWQRLHQERALSVFQNDGAPSARQKVQKTVAVLRAMLKEAGYDKDKRPLEHIGVETARFDISALAQNEGKKFTKPAAYQQKSGRELRELRAQQNNLCLYCGKPLGADATVDHIVARARGGGDKELNRAAAHSICNINKGKFAARANDAVLLYMEQNGAQRKAAFIRKALKEQKPDSFSGAQQTMLGAKLLKGSLTDALQLPADGALFPPVKPRETAQLRQWWFPLMHKQKRALRFASAPGKKLQATIGASLPPPLVLEWLEKYDDWQITPENENDLRPQMAQCAKWLRIEHARNGKGRRTTTIAVREGWQFKEGDECAFAINFYPHKNGKRDMRADGDFVFQSARVAVLPAENAPVREFHHAVDAVVCAAKIDWQKLARIDGALPTADKEYRRKLAPVLKFAPAAQWLPRITIGGEEHITAPPAASFLLADKKDQSGARRAKTDREPLKVEDGKVMQRVALYRIAKKDLGDITGKRMRKLMPDAFAALDNMPENEKAKYQNKDGTIAQEYFLALPKNHPLHPTNARGALCKKRGVGAGQMWKLRDKKRGARHHFKKTVPWDEAAVYEEAQPGKKPRRKVARTPEKFYINDANKGGFDELPQGAKIIARFRRGDKVIVKGRSGKWKIAELGKSAILTPLDDDARKNANSEGEVESVYTKLTKLRR